MLSIITRSLKTGVLTETDPFGGHPSFGFPTIDFSRCTACEDCVRSCPTGAIQAVTPAPGRKMLSLSYAACIQCRECVAACPEQAVSVSHDVEVAAYSREQLARSATFDVDSATGHATFRQVEAVAGSSLS
jgi:formate hydrogenlyase subunit 6/NADH:ubiquinone oxidoreductase subunit I